MTFVQYRLYVDQLLDDGDTPREERSVYDRRMHEFLAKWAAACKARGIDYNLVSTATPYQKALESYLHTRASLM